MGNHRIGEFRIQGLCLAGLLLAGVHGTGCGPVSKGADAPFPTHLARGLLEVASSLSAQKSTVALRTALKDQGLGVPLDLDHQAGAANADMTMPPSNVFVFGNPALGTPLMQENILAALDLPLKMLVSQDSSGSVQITYEAPDHLRERFGLIGVDAQLERAAGALAKLASAASGRLVEATEGHAEEIRVYEGLQLVDSSLSASDALAALVEAIEGNPMLRIFAQINHQSAAESVGLTLGFATVVIFGSATVGTPLMLNEDSFGLDLPLKILVTEHEGATVLAYSQPTFLAQRHGGLTSEQARLNGIATALSKLTAAASEASVARE